MKKSVRTKRIKKSIKRRSYKKSIKRRSYKKSIKRRSYKKSIKRRSYKKSIKRRYDGTLGSIQIKLKPLLDAVFYYNNPYFTKTLKFFYNIDNNNIGILIKQFFTFENDSILLKNNTLIEFIIKFDLLNDILPLLKSYDITVDLCNHEIPSKFNQANHKILINNFHNCFAEKDPSFNCIINNNTDYSKKSKEFLKNVNLEFITILNYVMLFFKEKTIREKIIIPYKTFYEIDDSYDVLMNFIFSLSKILYKMYCVRDIYTSYKIIDYVILHCINNLNRTPGTVMFITEDLTEPEKQLCNARNIFRFVDKNEKKNILFAYLRQLKYKTQQFSTCGETTLLNLFNLLLLKEDLNTFDTTNIIEAHKDLKNFYINYNSIEKQTKHIDPEKIIDNIKDTTRAWLDVVSNIDSLKIYTEIGDIRNSKQNILNCLNYLLKKNFVSIKEVVEFLNRKAKFVYTEDDDSMEFTITFNEDRKYEGYFKPGHAELNLFVKKTELPYFKKFEKFTDEKMFLDIMTYMQTQLRNGYDQESEITRIIITMFYDHCQNKYDATKEFTYDKIIDQILNNFVKPITIFKLNKDSGVDSSILVHFFKNYKYILDLMPNITSMYLDGVWNTYIIYCIIHDFQPILDYIFSKYKLQILDITYNNIDNVDNMVNNENLEFLYISDNYNILNLESLSTAKKLKTLITKGNKKIDLCPLINLEINTIDLNFCDGPLIMSNLSRVLTDESPLVKSLIDLNLSSSNIIDISLLEKFKMLKTLNLSNNTIYDMRLLSGLKNLEKLKLSDMSYIKMSPLNNSKLVELNLENSNINSFEFLNMMYSKSLKKLILNGVKTLHPINNNDLLPHCNKTTENVTELQTENTEIDRKDKDIKIHFPNLLS